MSYDSTILAEATLVSYWKGDDSGSSAVDSKGTNTGTYTGSPSLVAGLVTDGAQCHDYDGSTQYVSIAGAATLQPSSVTVEAWINADTVSSDDRVIALADDCFALSVFSGTLRAFFWNGATNRTTTGAITLSTATTYHVAATFDNASGDLIVLVNGVVDVTTNFFPQTIGWDATTTSAIASSSFGSSGSDFDGRTGKTAVYSSALAPASLLAHYNAGIAAGAAAPTLFVSQSNLRLG